MNNQNQLHVVLEQLLYPAILGGAIYSVFERLFFSQPAFLAIETGFLMLALIVLYVADYAYTVVNVTSSEYTLVQFFTDTLIVLCLYLAIKAALGDTIYGASTVFWLSITKLLSVAWEISEIVRKKGKGSNIVTYEVASDAAFLMIYLAITIFLHGTESYYIGLLASLVFADATTYWWHDWKYRKQAQEGNK